MLVPIIPILLFFIPSPGGVEPNAAEAADSVYTWPTSGSRHRLNPVEEDDVLWLARCIYSESDRPHEQRLVAWVVRNRVETKYRGTDYRDVVLETRQFSAFNDPSPRRDRILKLTAETQNPAWQRAYAIALDVYRAPSSSRPFSQTTRHFYSPVSMKGRIMPEWAVGAVPLDAESLGVDPHRFRFFASLEPASASGPSTEGKSSIENAAMDRPFNGRTRSGTRIGRSGDVSRPARPLRPARAPR